MIGLSAGAGLLGTPGGAAAEAEGSFVLEQGERCLPITPLSGNEPVEDFYDFAYPTDRFDGPPGSDGTTFSSEGTTDLQRDRTSILFLYDGPNGLSLVMVHGHLEGDRDQGGTVTFTFDGLPGSGEWLVRDDYYLQDGEQVESNYDRWNVEGDVHTVDWAYQGGRTDGGVFRGLGGDAEVVLEPAFNEAAALTEEVDFGPIEAWELLSGDRNDPERFPLRLDRPVTIRQGTCSGGQGGDGEQKPEPDDDDDRHEDDDRHDERDDDRHDDGDDDREDEDEDEDDRDDRREQRKHVKQKAEQRNERAKERAEQRQEDAKDRAKERKKHVKQQAKHRKKEARKRAKHQAKKAKERRKHIRKQVKHRAD